MAGERTLERSASEPQPIIRERASAGRGSQSGLSLRDDRTDVLALRWSSAFRSLFALYVSLHDYDLTEGGSARFTGFEQLRAARCGEELFCDRGPEHGRPLGQRGRARACRRARPGAAAEPTGAALPQRLPGDPADPAPGQPDRRRLDLAAAAPPRAWARSAGCSVWSGCRRRNGWPGSTRRCRRSSGSMSGTRLR